MSTTVFMIYAAAFTAGIVHTLVGPDHYAPFIVISRARAWPLRKALLVTLACGLAHVGSAVGLGVLAVRFASLLPKIGILEEVRGEVAAWALTAFGFAYAIWGLRKAFKRTVGYTDFGRADLGCDDSGRAGIVPAALFAIFALGPCEPLIPVYMAAASGGSAFEAIATTLIFGTATVATMTGVVAVALGAFGKIRFPATVSRFSHAFAGSAIGACGLAMAVFGL